MKIKTKLPEYQGVGIIPKYRKRKVNIMSKMETTMKAIRYNYRKVFRAGYCDLAHIFNGYDPQFYNAGIYGWNCDIYIDYGRDMAITTGYRNMAGASIPLDLIKKYDGIAREILDGQFGRPYEETRKAIDSNREAFLEELMKL